MHQWTSECEISPMTIIIIFSEHFFNVYSFLIFLIDMISLKDLDSLPVGQSSYFPAGSLTGTQLVVPAFSLLFGSTNSTEQYLPLPNAPLCSPASSAVSAV